MRLSSSHLQSCVLQFSAPTPSYPSRRMTVKQIIFISTLTTYFGIEVRPPVVKPPALRISYITNAFLPHCSGTGRCPSPVVHRHGYVDRTEQAKRNGGGYFMMERGPASVAWLASMFSLISFSRPTVSGSHRLSQHRNHIDVWSVLRFRFDKQRTLEADFMFMLTTICIKRPSCSRS